jgi:hypothetical protein
MSVFDTYLTLASLARISLPSVTRQRRGNYWKERKRRKAGRERKNWEGRMKFDCSYRRVCGITVGEEATKILLLEGRNDARIVPSFVIASEQVKQQKQQ